LIVNRILKLKLLPPFLRPRALALYRALPNRIHFSRVYRENLWVGDESLSGPGSTLDKTADLRLQLAALIRALGVRILVDAGCGDFNWMRQTDLDGIQYIGIDVVPNVIHELRQRCEAQGRRFLLRDFTRRLPRSDLVLCRQALQHLPNRDVLRFLRSVRRSHARHLLATTFPDVIENIDTYRGGFRRMNLESSPFNLPRPLKMLDDGDAPIGLWRIR
jgi:SAM-dependent methyltransferase